MCRALEELDQSQKSVGCCIKNNKQLQHPDLRHTSIRRLLEEVHQSGVSVGFKPE